MNSYADLAEADQIQAVLDLARQAAPAFGLDPGSAELTLHAYNTTFALTGGPTDRAALRVGTGSRSTPDDVVAQHAWIRHLDAAGFAVPRPIPTVDDPATDAVLVPSEVLGRDVLVTAAVWLDGADLDDPTPEDLLDLGRAMAGMHDAAATFRLPEGSRLPVRRDPLFGDEDVLSTWDGFDAAARAVVAEAKAVTGEVFERVVAPGPHQPCHGDLHGGNLKRLTDGRLAVLDFDDMGLSIPALDLAISCFYLDLPDHRAAVLAGYAGIRPQPELSGPDLEALIAARQLLLGNEVLGSTTAELRAMAPDYARRTVSRLRDWLATGVFRRDGSRF